MDECALGLHRCHPEAQCINRIRADNPEVKNSVFSRV